MGKQVSFIHIPYLLSPTSTGVVNDCSVTVFTLNNVCVVKYSVWGLSPVSVFSKIVFFLY